jgi:hypothetical protein
MTDRTCLFVREEIVEAAPVALAAAYLLHEDMLCVTVGVAEGDRALLNIGKVTSLAGVPGRNTAMLLLKRFVPLDHVRDKHPVLLQDIHGVACLAGEVPVLAHLPGLERLFHHMAGHAELGIFPGMLVITQAYDAADYRDEQKKDNNRFLVFFEKPYTEW